MHVRSAFSSLEEKWTASYSKWRQPRCIAYCLLTLRGDDYISSHLSSQGISGLAGNYWVSFRHAFQAPQTTPPHLTLFPRSQGSTAVFLLNANQLECVYLRRTVFAASWESPSTCDQITEQFASTRLVVLLVYIDQQFYSLVAHSLF